MLLAVVASTAVEGSVRVSLPPQSVTIRASELLDYYAAGEFDAVDEALHKPRTGEAVLDALRHDGRTWIKAGAPGQRNHRRLIAAALALDASHGPGFTSDIVSNDLIAFGRTLLAEGEPTDIERVWHRGALAAQGGAASADSKSLSRRRPVRRRCARRCVGAGRRCHACALESARRSLVLVRVGDGRRWPTLLKQLQASLQ